MARVVAGITTPVIVHVCYGYAMYSVRKSANPSYGEVIKLLADMPIAGMSIEYEQPGHSADLLQFVGDKHLHLGLLDLGTNEIETAGHIADRLREALAHVPRERLHASSDCGMWFLPREVARGKINALVQGANIIRWEIGLPVPAYADPSKF
jgi:5-methyltetrahydropteroyltriglutamate--homocysteine methyltransferase